MAYGFPAPIDSSEADDEVESKARSAPGRMIPVKGGRSAARMVAGVVALLGACAHGTSLTATPPSGASAVGGGCGSTALYRGASPAWTKSAAAPSGLVQATAAQGRAAAFLFGYPLRAGHPDNPSNKILWVMRLPRAGTDLVISGHPLGRSAPVVTLQQPANSAPGEIYPSIVDMPTPGCWRLSLQWHGHTDSIDLPYQ